MGVRPVLSQMSVTINAGEVGDATSEIGGVPSLQSRSNDEQAAGLQETGRVASYGGLFEFAMFLSDYAGEYSSPDRRTKAVTAATEEDSSVEGGGGQHAGSECDISSTASASSQDALDDQMANATAPSIGTASTASSPSQSGQPCAADVGFAAMRRQIHDSAVFAGNAFRFVGPSIMQTMEAPAPSSPLLRARAREDMLRLEHELHISTVERKRQLAAELEAALERISADERKRLRQERS